MHTYIHIRTPFTIFECMLLFVLFFDRYMDLMDGFGSALEEQDPTGLICLDEWQEYFRFVLVACVRLFLVIGWSVGKNKGGLGEPNSGNPFSRWSVCMY